MACMQNYFYGGNRTDWTLWHCSEANLSKEKSNSKLEDLGLEIPLIKKKKCNENYNAITNRAADFEGTKMFRFEITFQTKND